MLEAGRTARFDAHGFSLECRLIADAIIVCRILTPGSLSGLDAVVERVEPRSVELVTALREVHPEILPAMNLQALFDD